VDRSKHQRRRQRADAIVEFAFLAPLLALVLFGVMELSRVVDAWIVVHNAAREGARAGVVARPAPDAATAARNAATTYLNSASATRTDVARVVVNAPTVTSDAVRVTAEMDIIIYTPLVNSLIGSPVPVSASVTMPR
jgi:Flp pilus assembly protein TadG